MNETFVYKVLRQDEYTALNQSGSFDGSPIDRTDGYIHLSSATQLRETIEKHFAGVGELWVLRIKTAVLDDRLRWEESRGGKPFPHLYAVLDRSQIDRDWTYTVGSDADPSVPPER